MTAARVNIAPGETFTDLQLGAKNADGQSYDLTTGDWAATTWVTDAAYVEVMSSREVIERATDEDGDQVFSARLTVAEAAQYLKTTGTATTSYVWLIMVSSVANKYSDVKSLIINVANANALTVADDDAVALSTANTETPYRLTFEEQFLMPGRSEISSDQKKYYGLQHQETNDVRDRHNEIVDAAPLLHVEGFIGRRCYTLATDGSPIKWYRSSTATDEEIAQAVPGDASGNWVAEPVVTSEGSASEPYRALIGNGSSTSFTLVHELGRVPDDVSVMQISGSEEEEVGIKVRRTPTQLIIGPFAQAPGVNEYRVVAE